MIDMMNYLIILDTSGSMPNYHGGEGGGGMIMQQQYAKRNKKVRFHDPLIVVVARGGPRSSFSRGGIRILLASCRHRHSSNHRRHRCCYRSPCRTTSLAHVDVVVSLLPYEYVAVEALRLMTMLAPPPALARVR